MFKTSYIFDLVDKVSPQLKKIQSNLEATANAIRNSANDIIASSKQISQGFNNIGNQIRKTGTDILPLSAGIGAAGVMAVKSAANFETLAIQLEILTGSAEKGSKLFQELVKYSAETPFQLPEIVQATRTLLGSNIALENVVNTTKMLGDVAAGSGANIESLAVVFGQVAGATKLQGQDAMQFVSNGIPIWALLQKSTGKSIKQLRELSSEGKISFAMVEEAMTKATKRGGMYYEATNKLSKSLSGLYSTLKDNLNLALGEFGNELVKALNLKENMKIFGDWIGRMTEKFKALSPETKKFIAWFAVIITAIAPVLVAIGLFITAMGGIIFMVSALAGGIALLLTPVGAVAVAFIAASAAVYALWDDMKLIYDFIKDNLIAVFDSLGQKINGVKEFFGFGGGVNLNQNLIQNPSSINQNQSFTAGGQLDVNFKGLPQGASANFTPAPKNFMNVGLNTSFAGI